MYARGRLSQIPGFRVSGASDVSSCCRFYESHSSSGDDVEPVGVSWLAVTIHKAMARLL